MLISLVVSIILIHFREFINFYFILKTKLGTFPQLPKDLVVLSVTHSKLKSPVNLSGLERLTAM